MNYVLLTVNGTYLFWQLNGIWGGGWKHAPPRPRKLLKVWLLDFYQMLVSLRRHKIKKYFDANGPVCKWQIKISKNLIFGNATSRRANFAKFCKIVNIDVRNTFWKFQIDISRIGYFTEKSVKCRKKLVSKIQNAPQDAK